VNPEPQTIAPSLPAERAARDLGGLLALIEGAATPLPLTRVVVRSRLAGEHAHTTIEQFFYNAHSMPLEATHIFPLPHGGAVVAMELQAGDKVVRAECRERVDAERVFDEAREAGHRAGLLRKESADVHTLSVTNLPPLTEVIVRIVLIERLDCIDGEYRWRFPTVVAPRYIPGMPIGHAGSGVVPDTDLVPNASRLTPPLRLEGGTTLDLEAVVLGEVSELRSSLHAVKISVVDGESQGFRVAPSGEATLDRDFILAYSLRKPAQAAVSAWTDGAYTLVTLQPPESRPRTALPRDGIFLLDTSGSMGGAKLEAAKRALRIAVHGMQPGDRFQLVSFNTAWEAFAKGLAPFNDDTLLAADDWIAALQAAGGTELLPALKLALQAEDAEDRTRTVLVITDGQVGNDDALYAAVVNRRRNARLFTLGIDTAVNASLLERMAEAGGGTCTLLTPNDAIETAVANLEAAFGMPLLENLRLLDAGVADPRPRTLFAGRPASFMVEGAAPVVKIHGLQVQGEAELEARPERTTMPLGVFWAQERVVYLEDEIALRPHQEEALRGEVIRIALAHGIASRYTSFVAVDTSVTESGERVSVVQPVELPYGWSPEFLAADVGGSKLSAEARVTDRAKTRQSDDHAMGISRDGMKMPRFRRRSVGDDQAVRYSMIDAGRAPTVGPYDEIQRSLKVRLADLAGSQGADGSFGHTLLATVAGLVALILSGSTRSKGKYRGAVAKAATWLAERSEDADARRALDLLAAVEDGNGFEAHRDWIHGLVAHGRIPTEQAWLLKDMAAKRLG